MQIQLKAPKVWVASKPVDFRKSINGLSECVVIQFSQKLEDNIYVFYNRRKDKLKLLAYHRNGAILIYKRLDKKKFHLKENSLGLYEITEQQMAWLLAGLDWIEMSHFKEVAYEDYY